MKEYSNALVLDEGIWVSKNTQEISYPPDGNEICSQIEDDSYWFNHRNDCIYAGIKAYPPHGVIFDIGGGNGYVSVYLQSKGIRTVLIEPGMTGCHIAKSRGLSNIVCSTLENAEFYGNSIPAIGLFDVLEHIQDTPAFLSKISDLLCPNGSIYITVPSYNFLWSNDDVNAGHYRRYTIKSLSKLLTDNDFAIDHSTYFFSFLPVPIFLLRTIPTILGADKNKDKSKSKAEHVINSRFINYIFERIASLEIGLISRGKSIFVGGSCYIIAHKI